MIPVIWSPESQNDLERIQAVNETRASAWAEKVETRIVERVKSLSRLSGQGRRISSSVRVLPVPDVQYVVTYHVSDSLITILRVHHTRENRDD